MSEKTYRIGEAAAKLNLKTYVLRFWEMEFPQIAPIRTEKGQRLYRERDLALLRRIRYLLHERGLTIEGARRILREEADRGEEYKDAELAVPEDGQDAAFHEDASGGDDPPEGRDAENDPGADAWLEEKERADGEKAPDSHAAAPGLTFPDESAGWNRSVTAPQRQGRLLPAPAQAPVGHDAGARPAANMRMVMRELEDIRRLLTRGDNGDGT